MNILQIPIFWSISGLVLNITGAIILALPLLRTKKQREKISGMHWDYNPYLRTYLIQDKRKGLIGISFLILGFILQIVRYLI